MSKLPPNSGVRRDCTHPWAKHEHGTTKAYRQDQCRCIPCATAEKRYKHARRDSQPAVPAVGIRRRLDALATLGWTHAMIGERLGISGQAVQQARTRDVTHPATLARFAAVYDELWDRRPPALTRGQRIAVNKCVRLAVRRGYAPPLAWDDDTIDDPAAEPDYGVEEPDLIDEVAVSQALSGRPVKLTDEERTAAVQLAAAQGLSAKDTARQLAMQRRTVQRRRAAA